MVGMTNGEDEVEFPIALDRIQPNLFLKLVHSHVVALSPDHSQHYSIGLRRLKTPVQSHG